MVLNLRAMQSLPINNHKEDSPLLPYSEYSKHITKGEAVVIQIVLSLFGGSTFVQWFSTATLLPERAKVFFRLTNKQRCFNQYRFLTWQWTAFKLHACVAHVGGAVSEALVESGPGLKPRLRQWLATLSIVLPPPSKHPRLITLVSVWFYSEALSNS